MFRLVLIIYASLSTFQCCEFIEDEQYIGMGLPWDYLLNVTELGVAAVNGDVEMIERSLKGICVICICTECKSIYQKMVVMLTTMRL